MLADPDDVKDPDQLDILIQIEPQEPLALVKGGLPESRVAAGSSPALAGVRPSGDQLSGWDSTSVIISRCQAPSVARVGIRHGAQAPQAQHPLKSTILLWASCTLHRDGILGPELRVELLREDAHDLDWVVRIALVRRLRGHEWLLRHPGASSPSVPVRGLMVTT